MKKIFSIDVVLAAMCVAATSALWRHPYALAIVLLGVGALFAKRSSYRHAYIAFFGAAVGGAASEIIAIHFGAWSYALPQLFSIPVWLPFLWGNAALFVLAMSRLSEVDHNG